MEGTRCPSTCRSDSIHSTGRTCCSIRGTRRLSADEIAATLRNLPETKSMITQEEALAKILNGVRLAVARDATLARSRLFCGTRIFARLPMPLFDNSAMDGYAVVSSDCRQEQFCAWLANRQRASIEKPNLARAKLFAFSPGLRCPVGADAVIMQEDVKRDGSQITVNTVVARGEFVRRRGCDLSEGQKIVATGEKLRAENLALLAAQGLATIEVGGELDVPLFRPATNRASGNSSPIRATLRKQFCSLARAPRENWRQCAIKRACGG